MHDMPSMEQSMEMGESLVAGDTISYEDSDEMGDMVRDDLARRLRARGLRMSTEDCDYIEIVDLDDAE